jgi:hypothetical protein
MKYIKEEHEKFKTKDGNYRINGRKYWFGICPHCGEFLISREKNTIYCSSSCAMYNRIITDETKRRLSESHKGDKNVNFGKGMTKEQREKISKAHKGKKLSEEHKRKIGESVKGDKCFWFGKHLDGEHRRKISEANKGRKYPEEINIKKSRKNELNGMWKGGVKKLNIPLYDTYAMQIEKYEEIKRSIEGYLEVRCTYCGKWYMPKQYNVRNRIADLYYSTTSESRFYCSQGCKKQCPIYGKTAEELVRIDKIKAGLILSEELPREVQPELRQLVFLRDNYTCKICGSKHNLHCHHYEGVWQNQLMSADVDMCITLCKKCHIKVHKEPGCTYYDLRRKICSE